MVHRHAGTVHVGEQQGHGIDLAEGAVQQMVGSGGVLVHPIEIDGLNGMGLIDRQILWHAVDLARAGIDDPHSPRQAPARLQELQLRHRVNLHVPLREVHAVHVADLAGQVEDDVAGSEPIGEPFRLADRVRTHLDPVADRLDVVGIGAAARDRGIHDGDLRSGLDQPDREVAADEAKPARNQDFLIAVRQGLPSPLASPYAAPTSRKWSA
jgi:hypothetical protein